MDHAEHVTHVANVIEPNMNHLLGSYLQYLSLRTHPTPWEYHLVVVDRNDQITPQVVAWAEELGMQCRTSPPPSDNPYLNRWLFLPAYPRLVEVRNLVFVDWDIIYCSHKSLPASRKNQVLCRRNPLEMYRALVRCAKHILPAELVTDGLDLLSSVNAGVVIASGDVMQRLAEINFSWVTRLFEALDFGHLTDKDQMAFSVAVGQAGLVLLADSWNVTPLSPVADADVDLWHYNNSVHDMLQLKRQLLRPLIVRQTVEKFRGPWPRTMGVFERLYAEATSARPFRALLH